MNYKSGDKIISFAPASVANAGPCYDVVGYCLDYLGDYVEVTLTSEKGNLHWGGVKGPNSDALKHLNNDQNAAFAVAYAIWQENRNLTKFPFGVNLTLHKYMPISSGLGSSAASGVAAAKAIIEALGLKSLSDNQIARYLVNAEDVTAKAQHADNVVPSYFGGFCLIVYPGLIEGNEMPAEILRTSVEMNLVSIIVKPNIEIPTNVSRQKLREYISKTFIEEADEEKAALDILEHVKISSSVAGKMIWSVLKGNVEMFAQAMGSFNILERARGKLIHNFPTVKEQAIKAGALACTISGAGPSVVAVTSGYEKAEDIRDAMILAFGKGNDCKWLISPINNEGAKILNSSISNHIVNCKKNHNFYKD